MKKILIFNVYVKDISDVEFFLNNFQDNNPKYHIVSTQIMSAPMNFYNGIEVKYQIISTWSL